MIAGMLRFIGEAVQQHEEELCRLDSYVGDGDHGVTMTRGFTSVLNDLEGGKTPAEYFFAAGAALNASMGGAVGPIYGTMFTEFGKTCGGAEELNTVLLSRMFEVALESIKMIADVREGQKTLVDALSPASKALTDAANRGLSLADALDLAAEAAEAGAECTARMQARKGRAKFLKEKSIGYRDAGASSMAVIVAAMAEYVRKADCDEKATE